MIFDLYSTLSPNQSIITCEMNPFFFGFSFPVFVFLSAIPLVYIFCKKSDNNKFLFDGMWKVDHKEKSRMRSKNGKELNDV